MIKDQDAQGILGFLFILFICWLVLSPKGNELFKVGLGAWWLGILVGSGAASGVLIGTAIRSNSGAPFLGGVAFLAMTTYVIKGMGSSRTSIVGYETMWWIMTGSAAIGFAVSLYSRKPIRLDGDNASQGR